MKSPTQDPVDPSILVSVKGRKLRPITQRESFQRRQDEIDFRFVREVEHVEREGRAESRYRIEADLGVERGFVGLVRAGQRHVSPVHISMLFEKYRGDMDFIFFNRRNKELHAPFISGIGRIDRYEPYIHRYTNTARFRLGPQPETSPLYFPADPENKEWSEPAKRTNKKAS